MPQIAAERIRAALRVLEELAEAEAGDAEAMRNHAKIRAVRAGRMVLAQVRVAAETMLTDAEADGRIGPDCLVDMSDEGAAWVEQVEAMLAHPNRMVS